LRPQKPLLQRAIRLFEKGSHSTARNTGVVPEGVCEMHWNPLDQVQDVINKFGSEDRIKRWQSGELVLVERNVVSGAVSSKGLDNGGVTYASALNVEAFLDDWAKFLQDVFNVGLPNRKKIILPSTRTGFGWGVLTPKDMMIERAIASYSDVCPIWRWTNDDLDKIVKSVRSAEKGARVAWFRDRVEADEEHKKKSANDIKLARFNGATLLERLLLGRWFSWKTGSQHLDVVNATLCTGSRDSDGDVPFVHFGRFGGEVYVDRYFPDGASGVLRSREAVS